MSSLAWIDFDEAERQRAQRIMRFFNGRESRDELGLGAIRDSIADHLFPGTSTIQTRLRYMLFIPWLFQMLEQRGGSESEIRAEARRLEVKLAKALEAAGERNKGIIGGDAGERLQRLPSSVYWAGLGSWGIRRFPGSVSSLFATLCHRGSSFALASGGDVGRGRRESLWVATLPKAPDELLDRIGFNLRQDEAEFIVDRLIATHRGSLLTWLARKRSAAECDFIWTHPKLAEFPLDAQHLLGHAEIFSEVMHGAALIYNLALSELRERDDWAADYRERLEEWRAELDLAGLEAWSLDGFWAIVAHPEHRIQPAAKRFVAEWCDLLKAGTPHLALSPVARNLVEIRERRLKKSQSRYANRAVLDRWSGASGVNRLGFRWSQAQSHLKDLANAR
ncbi:MAG TPA: DUF6361 family protein [Gammaproteobacteria bacterium]|nr:DUF6361 family protein [Gammaproteobacteria bacterium]